MPFFTQVDAVVVVESARGLGTAGRLRQVTTNSSAHLGVRAAGFIGVAHDGPFRFLTPSGWRTVAESGPGVAAAASCGIFNAAPFTFRGRLFYLCLRVDLRKLGPLIRRN